MPKLPSLPGWQDVDEHLAVTGTELLEMVAALAERHVIGPGRDVKAIEIEPVVLPKTDRTDIVLTPGGEREVVTARALKKVVRRHLAIKISTGVTQALRRG